MEQGPITFAPTVYAIREGPPKGTIEFTEGDAGLTV
jgi:hypothetical protein